MQRDILLVLVKAERTDPDDVMPQWRWPARVVAACGITPAGWGLLGIPPSTRHNTEASDLSFPTAPYSCRPTDSELASSAPTGT